jgi:hypothetical protein
LIQVKISSGFLNLKLGHHLMNEAECRRVFVALAQDHADRFMVHDDAENFANHKVIVELAEKNRLPAIYPARIFVDGGGLMSYGMDVSLSASASPTLSTRS